MRPFMGRCVSSFDTVRVVWEVRIGDVCLDRKRYLGSAWCHLEYELGHQNCSRGLLTVVQIAPTPLLGVLVSAVLALLILGIVAVEDVGTIASERMVTASYTWDEKGRLASFVDDGSVHVWQRGLF